MMMAPVSVARSIMKLRLEAVLGVGDARRRARGGPSASVLMISMVWPDMAVTMSPGRWAAPSGMFSTRPMTPTALTLALRPASACMRPVTAAAPPMSPFMSSMPPAGLIEMPPVSKTTPLPTKATGWSLARAAVPAHDHQARRARRALRDAEQRAHAELLHLRSRSAPRPRRRGSSAPSPARRTRPGRARWPAR